MLVLTRKQGEQIQVGDDLTITVVAIRGDRVRIGIEAPRETPVHRGEILAGLLEQRRLLSAGEPGGLVEVESRGVGG